MHTFSLLAVPFAFLVTKALGNACVVGSAPKDVDNAQLCCTHTDVAGTWFSGDAEQGICVLEAGVAQTSFEDCVNYFASGSDLICIQCDGESPSAQL